MSIKTKNIFVTACKDKEVELALFIHKLLKFKHCLSIKLIANHWSSSRHVQTLNADLIHWHIFAAPGGYELTQIVSGVFRIYNFVVVGFQILHVIPL